VSGIVSVLNPKVVLFFLAFISQFVNTRQGDVATQMLFLGAVYVGLVLLTDSLYAVLAGRAPVWLGSKLACSAWLRHWRCLQPIRSTKIVFVPMESPSPIISPGA